MNDSIIILPSGTKIEKSLKSSIPGNNSPVGFLPDLMIKDYDKNDNPEPLLDKLAQLRKNKVEKFKKRAKSKYITMGFLSDLIALKSSLEKSYKNTWFCVKELIYDHEKSKITGKYCNNRWCLVCNRIRTGKLINGYFGEISGFKEKHMVTLTIPNISESDLKPAIKDMNKTFRKILDIARKRALKINGIRKTECTYNFKTDTFHPHYHLIVDGKLQSEFIVKEWLKKYPGAKRKAQDIRVANDNSIKELFKYFTKIVTRTKEQNKNEYPVFIKPLDAINRAFYGLRVFQPFGEVKKQSEDIEDIQSENLEFVFDGNIWEWIQTESDWVSEFGELLTQNNYNKKITVKTK